MKKNWYNSNLAILALHVAVWLLFILVPHWFQSNIRPPAMNGNLVPGNTPPVRPMGPMGPLLRVNIMLIIVFYLNAYLLFPLLNKRKTGLFVIAHLLLLACFLLVDYAFFSADKRAMFPFQGVMFRLTVSYLSIVAVSSSYRIIIGYLQSREALKEKENEALKSELALLRSQVSPHFMFNVLNSMVALARKKEDLEPSLIRLSSLMRYMIYSSKEDKVLLHKEIEYLKSYIDLQSLRFGQSAQIDIRLQNEANPDCTIEPMLLIPFIENAFKHGTNYIGDPDIEIVLTVSAANRLKLHVANNYGDVKTEDTDHSSGIGLENVKKRLELLYKNNYVLNTIAKENRFVVEMDLNLS